MTNMTKTNSGFGLGSTWPTTVAVWPKIIKSATDNHSFNNEQDYPSMPSLSKGYED